MRSLEKPLASAAAISRSLKARVMAGTTRPVSVTYSLEGDVSPVLIWRNSTGAASITFWKKTESLEDPDKQHIRLGWAKVA